jgi:t-SNARE complex subunit (syntaxin)
LIFGLWFFGYLSFHSREKGQAISRIENVTAELKEAETQLAQLTIVLEEMKSETAELTEERKALARQVARLERVRTNIAANLDAAEGLVAPARGGRIESARRLLFDGVPGNIVATAIVALFVFVYRRKIASRFRRATRNDPDTAV